MKANQNLTLYEEILLLALRDREGTVPATANCSPALGGAILAELILANRIEIETEKRSHWVTVKSKRPLADPILDECLEKVAKAKRRARAQTWVSRFSMLKDLRHRVAERLCDRGIVKADRSAVLWVFSRRVYPELDPRPEREVIRRLKQAIFTHTSDVDARTLVLLSLARGADLLRFVFDKKALAGRKKRIESLVSGQAAGAATREAIQAAQAAQVAAVMVACMVPTMTVHSAHSH